ncbi:hypothetical protein OIU76_025406 [Salix suchowensis]|nr:hypothetical protein OIU76_025406 [Salix suchowensis]
MLTTTALHHLHIFIFVLACVHVLFCALTILFGSAKIRLWKRWEDSISSKAQDPEQAQDPTLTHVQDHDFIRTRYLGFGRNSYFLGWVVSPFMANFDKLNTKTCRNDNHLDLFYTGRISQ